MAIDAEPKNAEPHLLRAIWDRYAGRDDDARTDLTQALTLDASSRPRAICAAAWSWKRTTPIA